MTSPPGPAGRRRRHRPPARRPVGDRRRALQRHGRRRSRATPTSATSASTSRSRRAAPAPPTSPWCGPTGRPRWRRPDLRFPNGSVVTPDGSTLDRRRVDGRAATPRSPSATTARSPTGGCGPRCPGRDPTAAPSTPTAPSGWPTPFGSGASASPRAARSSTTVAASQPVFACALGGADRRTLYLVTAPGFGEDVRRQGPRPHRDRRRRRPRRRLALTRARRGLEHVAERLDGLEVGAGVGRPGHAQHADLDGLPLAAHRRRRGRRDPGVETQRR